MIRARMPTRKGYQARSATRELGSRPAPDSLARQALRRFLKHRLAVGGALLMATIVLIAIAAPLVAPHDPNFIDLRNMRRPPSGAHWLGTDLAGRDVWSRLAYGGRTSLTVGLGAVTIYVAIGTTLGALAGYFGGLVDQVVMRVTETIMSIPSLVMIIVFVSVVGPSLLSVIIVIGLLNWAGAARLVRGQFLSLRQEEYVLAARVVGANALRIIIRHLLPNTLGPLTVLATFGIANAILLEAALGFLGLGVRPPTPTWGGMLNEAQSPTVLGQFPWLWLAPGIAIACTVLAANFIGDGVRDAVDPRASRK